MRGVISSLNTFLFFCWVKKAKVNQVHNTEYEYKNEYIQLEYEYNYAAVIIAQSYTIYENYDAPVLSKSSTLNVLFFIQ